jgi:glycerol-3-phosphate acyltransferase PlsY
VAALIGHIYPVWLKGKGGKGVATYFGILAAIHPLVFLIAISNWLGVFYTKRISSFSALIAAFFTPLWLYIFTDLYGMFYGILTGALLAYTHRANIERLLNGTEPPFISRKEEV